MGTNICVIRKSVMLSEYLITIDIPTLQSKHPNILGESIILDHVYMYSISSQIYIQ